MLYKIIGQTDRARHALLIDRLDQLDCKLAALAAQVEAVAIDVTSQTGSIAAAVGIVQSQVADARNSATAHMKVIEGILISLVNRQEREFRRDQDRTSDHASAESTRYLDLMEAVLTGSLNEDGAIAQSGVEPYDAARRAVGFDWPAHAETMIGRARMRNFRILIERALTEGVPGDIIETGVWRGGACIYARAILAVHQDSKRRVFVADSFCGLPPPNGDIFPADIGDTHSTMRELSVSREQVEANFRRYGLLDDRVVFLEGWFKDTLACAPIENISVLRLDGDMYESTFVALDSLYRKVSPGGFVIVDDYVLPACAEAVQDFREREKIVEPVHPIDGAAVWWQVPAVSA